MDPPVNRRLRCGWYRPEEWAGDDRGGEAAHGARATRCPVPEWRSEQADSTAGPAAPNPA